MVVEYCGYSGSTSTRRTPSVRSCCRRRGQRRLAVAHRVDHAQRLAAASCTACASRRVYTASGEPPSSPRTQMLAYFFATAVARSGRIDQVQQRAATARAAGRPRDDRRGIRPGSGAPPPASRVGRAQVDQHQGRVGGGGGMRVVGDGDAGGGLHLHRMTAAPADGHQGARRRRTLPSTASPGCEAGGGVSPASRQIRAKGRGIFQLMRRAAVCVA